MFKPKPLKPVLYEFVFRAKMTLKGIFSAAFCRNTLLRASYVVTFRRIGLLTGVFVLSCAIWLPTRFTGTASAANPTLNFQARLENGSGGIAQDGNYNVQFKLYQGGTSTGGGTLKWTENYLYNGGSPDQRVHVANGYLTVNLGSITSFPGTINWDDDLFLSLNIGDTSTCTIATDFDTDCGGDGEMDPLLKLTSVPYAFQAQSAAQLQTIQGGNTGTLSFDTLSTDRDILLPDEDGTVCLQGAASCGFAADSGSTNYIQNGVSLQTSANFNIQAADSTTDGTIAAVLRGAAGGQTVDLMQFQASDGTPLAVVTAAGNLNVAASIDTYTATTLSIGVANATDITIGQTGVTTTNAGALTVDELLTANAGATVSGGAIDLEGNAASKFTTSSGALTLTSAVAATWSTTAGDLTLQAGSGEVSLGTSTKLKSNGALTITTGGATALTLDTGAAAGISIGTSNATDITLGHNAGTLGIDATNFDLSTAGVLTLAGGQTNDITTQTNANLTLQANGTGTIVLNDTITANGTLTFNGVATDITTGTNEDLTIDANGTGNLVINDNTDIAADKALSTKVGSTFTTAGTIPDDTSLGGGSYYLLDTSGAAQVFNSIAAGRDGQRLTLTNIDAANTVTLNNNGSGINKIITGTGANITIPVGGSVELVFDSANARWRVVGTSSTAGGYIQNQNTAQQTGATFWIQNAGRSDTSFLAPLFDTATAVALGIGTTNATNITIGHNAGTFAVDGTNFDLSTAGVLTLAGGQTNDITTQSNTNLTLQANGTGTIVLNDTTTANGTLTFSGVTTDITTATNEDLTVVANGTGTIVLNDTTTANGTLTFSGVTTDVTTATNEDLTVVANGTGTIVLNDTVTVAGTVTYSGVATDITTGTNEDFTIDANGSGKVVLNDNVDISSSTSLATRVGTTFTTAGTSNNAALNGAGFYLLDTSGAAQIINGITAGRDGQQLTLTNVDASLSVTLSNNSGSATGSKIITGSGVNVIIPVGGSANLVYDNANSVWRVVSGGTGSGVALQATTPGSAQTGNFNVSGTGIAGTAFQAPLFDTATAVAMGIGTTNATNITIGHNAGTFAVDGTNFDIATSGLVTLKGGVAGGDILTQGTNALGIDTGGAAAINIGAANATSIVIGRSAAGQTIRVGQNSSTVQIDGTNFDVSTAGVVTLAGGQTNDILTAGATTLKIDTGGSAALSLGSTNASSINIGNSSATAVTIQTAAGSGNGVAVQSSSATALRVQTSGGGSTLLTADATASRRVTVGTVGSIYGTSTSNGDLVVVGNAELQGRLYIGDGSTNAVYTNSAGGALRFKGNARNDIRIVLSPEYAGATLQGTGVGTMTASFCSDALNINDGGGANPCGTSQEHNYYSWTANASNSYSVYTKWHVPSNFDSFDPTTPVQFNGWSRSANHTVALTVYKNGTTCGTATVSNTGGWGTSSAISLSGCSISPDDDLVFKATLSIGTGGVMNTDYVLMGEITIKYKTQF